MNKVTAMDTGATSAGSDAYEDLPGEHVTIDQIVALNIRHWRRAAEMTQEELGERIGWSAANISAAGRSADSGRDRRRLDAHTIASAAIALGVPIVALFLPPPDDGLRQRYLFHNRERDADCLSITDLMDIVIPDSGDDTPVMTAYRERLQGAISAYLDPSFGAQVARFLRKVSHDGGRRAAYCESPKGSYVVLCRPPGPYRRATAAQWWGPRIAGGLAAEVAVDGRPGDAELICDLLDGVAALAVLADLVEK
jgi:transcriptional regulator with XRE-family HTH domain